MTWILIFFVYLRDPIYGGEYISEQGCRQAARNQISYWREQYGRRLVSYRCVREDVMDVDKKELNYD